MFLKNQTGTRDDTRLHTRIFFSTGEVSRWRGWMTNMHHTRNNILSGEVSREEQLSDKYNTQPALIFIPAKFPGMGNLVTYMLPININKL